MTNLMQMSVSEAASKALEILLLGNGYDTVEHINDEYLDSYTTQLSDSEGAWGYVKWENKAHTVDGLTAKVEAEHGGEGMGEEYWVVISLSDAETTTRYFRKDGWYASYDGGYLDGETREVSPREKTIVVFE